MSIHDRIAKALGWSDAEVRSLSMASLREIVRAADPSLASEISDTIQTGQHVTTNPTRSRKRR